MTIPSSIKYIRIKNSQTGELSEKIPIAVDYSNVENVLTATEEEISNLQK